MSKERSNDYRTLEKVKVRESAGSADTISHLTLTELVRRLQEEIAANAVLGTRCKSEDLEFVIGVKEIIDSAQQANNPELTECEEVAIHEIAEILRRVHHLTEPSNIPKLECGFMVVRRNGSTCAILPTYGGLALQEDADFIRCRVSDYTNSLRSKNKPAYDIMQVYGQRPCAFTFGLDGRKLLWERKDDVLNHMDVERMLKLFNKAIVELATTIQEENHINSKKGDTFNAEND